MDNTSKIRQFLFNRNRITIYVLLLLCIFFSLTTDTYFTARNAIIILRQVSTNGILALGMTFLVISGNNDLAAGSTLALTGVVAALAMGQWGMSVPVALLAGIAVSVVVSAITGTIVAKGKLPAFIVTLGVAQVVRGVTLIWSNGMPIGSLPESFVKFGSGSWLGIPSSVYVYAIAIIFAWVFLNKTRLGRYTYAIGGNQEAARLSGINVDWCKIKIYLIHGVLVGVSGLVLAARVQSGQPGIGQGYELEAISASVIGGTSFAGGVGTVFGALVGTLIMGVISNGLDLMHVSTFYKQIIQGLIIIVAVFMDRKRKR
ncbi:ABC transporter permease [Enterocloster lavalensis]|uniref:ABC transporter permease n=1 Tax=Enterocloster lavalensis TaxID=460384 RepID=UPI00140980C1|nr:ABC transporter permease [Enterocloster lavalensis]